MRIFAIKAEHDLLNADIAYLFYYEQEKRFYIELPDDADPWNTPLILSSLLKRGERTVNSYWSKILVQQRIIPSDRQNLGQILKESGLDSYDEFQLLLLNEGRCSQDDYYIKEISPGDLPKEFLDRLQYKVEDVIPLAGKSLLVFFRNGLIKRCELQPILTADNVFSPLLKNNDYFNEVGILVGGYGVCWGDQLTISDRALYETGKVIPLSQEDFVTFVQQRIVTSTEAAELLQCSKQNIDDLVRRGKLHPIKTSPKSKLFLKSEILQRLWK